MTLSGGFDLDERITMPQIVFAVNLDLDVTRVRIQPFLLRGAPDAVIGLAHLAEFLDADPA
jgi:hypothetical protein